MSGYIVGDGPPWYKTGPVRRLLLIMGAFAILIALNEFTTTERSVEIGLSVWVLCSLAAVFWGYRREVWLWLTLALFAGVHAVVIALVPIRFPEGPAISYIFPAVMVDSFAIFGVLKLLASRFTTSPP